MNVQDRLSTRAKELEQSDRSSLRVNWIKAFGKAPPHFLSMRYMRKALIWDEQRRAFGGLSADVKRSIKTTQAGSNRKTPPQVVLKPGNQLVREWNGKTFTVDVIDGGFLLGSKRFKSLSAIARQITGAHWSGPRFFGLTGNGDKS